MTVKTFAEYLPEFTFITAMRIRERDGKAVEFFNGYTGAISSNYMEHKIVKNGINITAFNDYAEIQVTVCKPKLLLKYSEHDPENFKCIPDLPEKLLAFFQAYEACLCDKGSNSKRAVLQNCYEELESIINLRESEGILGSVMAKDLRELTTKKLNSDEI
jgi:hypothetical protein